MARKLMLDDIMAFECNDRRRCFGKCCRSAPNIWLTPYDIVRIKNNLGMSSGEFLRSYTQASYPREAGYPTVWMRRQSDASGSCPFSTDRGCAVYADRPWVCRMFPLVPVGADARPAPCADNFSPIFTINKVDYCNGFDSSSGTSIRQWREKEGLILYEEINAEWKAVTHHRDFRKRNFLEGSDSDLFFSCCYDIDTFRKIASEKELLKGFEPADRSCETGIDDTALLKLSFKWLRHVMFGETMSKSGR